MRQRLGQHFLRDDKVVQTILAAGELSAIDEVLEIGPGKGVLTSGLVSRVKRLVAVELDDQLAPALSLRLGKPANLEVIHADFLNTDLETLFPTGVSPKIMGNLPYSITAPILEKVGAWPRWTQAVFLIQKEVADRLLASPGTKAYGLLTLAVQMYASVEPILTVPPGAFVPPPEVTSKVVRLRRKTAPEVRAEALPAFFAVARVAFQHRRKTLENALSYGFPLPKNELAKALEEAGISPAARAEEVPWQNYARLAQNTQFSVDKSKKSND